MALTDESTGNGFYMPVAPAKDAWLLMDELIEAVTVFNPRLMTDFYDKLRAL